MIDEFVKKWEDGKTNIESAFKESHPKEYKDIVKAVVKAVGAGSEYDVPDPERIHVIDDGDCQGTLLFVIAAKRLHPYDYWFVKVNYGSCSGCDTLKAICGYDDKPPTPEQVKDYMTLALHIAQGLKKMDGEIVKPALQPDPNHLAG